MVKLLFSLALWVTINFWLALPVFARITPEDIVQSKRADYNTKVESYSNTGKQRLEELQSQIAQVNQNRTNQLSQIMTKQAIILDEFQRRNGGIETEQIKKSRYWITYAHEAVAYQAAKIYIPSLSSESRISGDMANTISLLQSELNSARKKVIYSQEFLKKTVTQN